MSNKRPSDECVYLPGLDTQLDNSACRVVWWALYFADGREEVVSPHLIDQINLTYSFNRILPRGVSPFCDRSPPIKKESLILEE